ncbi:MAG: transposase [Candidatus Curtissbacteria bacterium]|nr:transposase [Candidatus Curtissbacteria bacterium]
MPAKNSIKQFVENGIYHLYNRGVEKRNIFLDEQDYSVFLGYIKQYLDDTEPDTGSDPKSLAGEIDLLAFCLMPNHFHFLVKQTTKDGITKFIRAVCTNYVMYFNKKYDRVGTLFQGKYKGLLIDNDVYLLHLSRYIHLNPLKIGSDPKQSYSSYSYYLGRKQAKWLKPDTVLDFFRTASKTSLTDYLSYESFVDDYVEEPGTVIEDLTLEDESED